MGHRLRQSVEMKLLISLGLLAYASALHDSHCNSFLTVKRSRSKRSPDYSYDGSTVSGYSSAATTNAPTTQPSTAASSTASQAKTTAQSSTKETQPATKETQPAVETASSQTTEAPASTTAGTIQTIMNDERTGTDYLILLDATGSMQKLNGAGQGRDFVIGKFNQFLKTLRTQVDNEGNEDGKITVVIFNKKAEWIEYNSIKNVKDLSRQDYNPGWGTNLSDTMGCTLQKFKQESTATTKLVYVLTDGKHEVRRSTHVAHSAEDVSNLVNQYRNDDDFQFSFLALINKDKPDEKRILKEGAKDMGIISAEIRTSNFDGANFTGMLKSVIRSMRKNNKKPQAIPACGACPKGKPGKKCRKQRKRDKANKRCQ